jgi:hypothetical protein
MPLGFRELLGEDHLVWTVLEIVDQFDLTELYAHYGDHDQRGDGVARPPGDAPSGALHPHQPEELGRNAD